MKMTNAEAIARHNELDEFQRREKEYFKNKGEKLLKGRVKISYAIEKNKEEIRRQTKAYNKTLESIVAEYRDTEAEAKEIQKEQDLAKKEGRDPKDISIIMKDGKTKEEYLEKLNELQQLEIDVPIYTIGPDLFDGLDLDSADLRPFMFMFE